MDARLHNQLKGLRTVAAHALGGEGGERHRGIVLRGFRWQSMQRKPHWNLSSCLTLWRARMFPSQGYWRSSKIWREGMISRKTGRNKTKKNSTADLCHCLQETIFAIVHYYKYISFYLELEINAFQCHCVACTAVFFVVLLCVLCRVVLLF